MWQRIQVADTQVRNRIDMALNGNAVQRPGGRIELGNESGLLKLAVGARVIVYTVESGCIPPVHRHCPADGWGNIYSQRNERYAD